jgi:hypothetical protein
VMEKNHSLLPQARAQRKRSASRRIPQSSKESKRLLIALCRLIPGHENEDRRLERTLHARKHSLERASFQYHAPLRCASACGSEEGILSFFTRHSFLIPLRGTRKRAGLFSVVPLRRDCRVVFADTKEVRLTRAALTRE